MTTRLHDLVKEWRERADDVDTYGDFNCGLAHGHRQCADALEQELAGEGKLDAEEYAELVRLREITSTPPEVWRGWQDLSKANSAIVDEIRDIVLPNKQPGNIVEAVRRLAGGGVDK